MGAFLLALAASGGALVFALHSQSSCEDLLTVSLGRAAAIHELRVALSRQSERNAWLPIDDSSRRLEQLAEAQSEFEHCLAHVGEVWSGADGRALLEPIREGYEACGRQCEQALALQESGGIAESREMLAGPVAESYAAVDRLCAALVAANDRDTGEAIAVRHAEARGVMVRLGVLLGILAAAGVGMFWLFLGRVLGPLQRLTEDAREYLDAASTQAAGSEIGAVGKYVQQLKSSVAEAHRSLAQSQQRLLDAEKLATVGKLAAGVAHEIRSPLTSIKLRLFSMQKMLAENPRCVNDVRILSDEIGRLDSIIRNFLEFSRPPALLVQRCDVAMLVDRTLELLRFKLEAAGISLVRQAGPDLPPLTVDPNQMRQVLLNLLNNAIEAQPAGGSIRIEIKFEPNRESEGMVVLRIRDAGPGVPAEIAGRIFDPFFSTKSDGAGLGLWIAHRIVAQHGGVLELETSARTARRSPFGSPSDRGQSMSTILVVDDDPSVLAAFERVLTEHDHSVTTAGNGAAALALVSAERPDLVVMDIRMPGMTGLEAFQRMRRVRPKMPVIIMTGYATMETAVEATKLGAFDYHIKPLDPQDMLQSIDSALECVRLMAGEVRLDSENESPGEDAMVGSSRAMQEVYMAIGRVAPTNATVLIRGETGTGKELVARAIYQHSPRVGAPLVVINCAAIPEMLLESELFGHERGAFTGAECRRIGKLEQAGGGTLFLDEIGDMPLTTQAKLLRVIQDHALQRVGGNETIQVDLRILAATNRNLEQAIIEGRFREDLLHRLKVFSIEVPPLRDRIEDLPRLVSYFTGKFAHELGFEKPVVAEEAMAVLRGHSWPGNVRELEHVLHRAMILRQGYPIQAEDILGSLESRQASGEAGAGTRQRPVLEDLALAYLRSPRGRSAHAGFLGDAEKAILSEALRLTRGNQTHAARLLGITRPTLKAKMDRHGLG